MLGDFLVLVAALGWTGAIILNKRMPGEISAVSVIFWSSAGAIPVYGLLTLLLEPGDTWHLTASAIGSLLYLGVVAACPCKHRDGRRLTGWAGGGLIAIWPPRRRTRHRLRVRRAGVLKER